MANRIAPAGFLARTEAETRRFGAEFAAGLAGGAVVSLKGPMGAGKTCFVQGLAEGLGLDADEVASPTFPIVHEYGTGRLLHFDLYRLEHADELAAVGWDDALASGGICVVEWGDKFPTMLPPGAIHLDFEIEGAARRITVRGPLP